MPFPYLLLAALVAGASAHSALPLARRHHARAIVAAPADHPLVPAISPVTDRTQLSHLTAQKSLQLFYTHHPDAAYESYAQLTAPVVQYGTVVADHSDQIDSISCDTSSCVVDFVSVAGLETFSANFAQDDKIVVVASDVTFSVADPPSALEHQYLLFSAIKPDADALSLTASYKLVDFEAIVDPSDTFTVQIGNGAASSSAPSQTKRELASPTIEKRLKFTPIRKSVPINLNPGKQVDTKYGKGVKLFSKSSDKKPAGSASSAASSAPASSSGPTAKKSYSLDVYCIRCGLNGDLAFDSLIETSWFSLKQVNGHAKAELGFAILAEFEYTSKPEPINLFRGGPGSISIPKILTLGPTFTLSTGYDLNLKASGDIYGGVALTWDKFHNRLDIMDSQRSGSSGWTPTITRQFNASGEIHAAAGAYLIVGIEFTIDILNGKLKASAGINEKPRLEITADAKASTADGGFNTGADGCKGIELGMSLNNEVYLEAKFQSSTQHKTLDERKLYDAKTCLALQA